MIKTKSTLPRHTNLAKQSTRTGAFFIDLALVVLSTLILFFGCFNLIVKSNPTYKEKNLVLANYEVQSHLLYKDSEGNNTIYTKNNTKEQFASALEYYYLSYLTGVGIDPSNAAPNYLEPIKDGEESKLPAKYYTVSWYNYNVLGITIDNPDAEKSECYFTYQKDNQGNFIKDKIGIPRDHRYSESYGGKITLSDTDIVSYYQNVYVDAYNHLVGQNFYMSILDPLAFVESLAVVLSFVFGSAIIYILLPYILKNGQTPGKKLLKLGLANYEGFKFNNAYLWLRFIPLFLVSGITLLPIFNGVLVLFIIYLVIFLVSFALAMASPKKSALHDFVARTMVIDLKTSIIFENELEEEEYLEKEDGLISNGPVECGGEEPELKYEK